MLPAVCVHTVFNYICTRSTGKPQDYKALIYRFNPTVSRSELGGDGNIAIGLSYAAIDYRRVPLSRSSFRTKEHFLFVK